MCKITDKEVQQDGEVVSGAITNLATLISKTDPTLGGELSAAAATLLTVTSTWTTGSPVADFNSAASAVEDVLALVPTTSVFVPFVEIAVTALDVLIANVGTSPAAGQPAAEITVDSVKDMQAKIATFKPNPFRGQREIHRGHFQSPRAAFLKAWDDEVDAAPEAGVSKLAA